MEVGRIMGPLAIASMVFACVFSCALCVSGSIFLVEEMARPFEGILRIPSKAQHDALSRLGK
jgi:hypothetical protein